MNSRLGSPLYLRNQRRPIDVAAGDGKKEGKSKSRAEVQIYPCSVNHQLNFSPVPTYERSSLLPILQLSGSLNSKL